MEILGRRRVRLSRGLLLVGVLLAGCLVFFSALPETGFVFPHLINSGHAFVFALASYGLMRLLVQPGSSFSQAVVLALFALIFGCTIELIQPYLGRQRSVVDVFYDLLGCLAALSWFYARYQCASFSRKYSFYLLALLLVGSSLAYPLSRAHYAWQAERMLPVLADFEQPELAHLIEARNGASLTFVAPPKAWAHTGVVGEISFPRAHIYPGLGFLYLPSDWHGYSALAFEIYSAHLSTVPLVLRIHDAEHNNDHSDRFNQRLEIKPGENKFSILLSDIQYSPKDRELFMAKIENMMFFMGRPEKDYTLYIDNIRLQP
jgi:VanZ family protein